MAQLGFIGLGAMGSRMVGHLIEAGHDVSVFNRSVRAAAPLVERGARRATSPREAAQGASVVFSMVTDDRASEAVWLDPENGAVAGLSRGALAVECSTLTPAWVRELRTHVVRARGRFVDAPLAGSLPQADAKQLIFFVGCEEAELEDARPLLAEMGSSIHHVGGVGHGALFKLAINALFASQVEMVSELVGVLKRSGIAPVDAARVLVELPVTSPAASGALGMIVADTYAPMFPVDLVRKDLDYAEQTAREVASSVPALSAVRAVYERAASAGYGALNIHAVAKLFV